ncbi:TadE family type IV pilus minor pilin [Arthrobacter sp. MMS24-S77]
MTRRQGSKSRAENSVRPWVPAVRRGRHSSHARRHSSARRSSSEEKLHGSGKGHRSQALPDRDRGAVTAEFAVVLPAVLLLLALLLAGSAAGITQLRLEEAARAGARALARGDGNSAVDGIVRRLAGDAASAVVSEDGEWIKVTVSAPVAGPLGSLIPWRLSAAALARGETPRGSAATLPWFDVGDSVVEFHGAVPAVARLGLQRLVDEVAA